eukprot:5728257-Amphidinium_carterae.1
MQFLDDLAAREAFLEWFMDGQPACNIVWHVWRVAVLENPCATSFASMKGGSPSILPWYMQEGMNVEEKSSSEQLSMKWTFLPSDMKRGP